MPTRASGVPGVLVPRMVRRCRLPARLWVRDYRLAVRVVRYAARTFCMPVRAKPQCELCVCYENFE